MLTIVSSPAAAQAPSPAQTGVAWQVQGKWQANGRQGAIHDGDPVEAGSLLQPVGAAADHSIVILLPDSQRVIYECFASNDCARGFIVPKLMRAPDPFAVEMLAQIRAELAREGRSAAEAAPSMRRLVPRDELLVELDSTGRVEIGGLAESLPNGHYVCYVQRIDARDAGPLHLEVEKSAWRFWLPLPGAGIYKVAIRDDRDLLRIDLLMAAEKADRASELAKPFDRAKALLQAWKEVFYGWPVHELLRAYLQAIVLDVQPARPRVADAVATVDWAQSDGVTTQPAFSPRAGYQGGDTAVSLQSATKGATIHYMLDGAQPTPSSPVYHAPIIVKESGLTIKAFASAPGLKDSPVVTGTFLIQQ